MHVYTHIHIYICIYIHLYLCISTHIYTHIYIHIHMYINMYTYTHTQMYIYIHYIHTYVHMYIYIYMCLHIYIQACKYITCFCAQQPETRCRTGRGVCFQNIICKHATFMHTRTLKRAQSMHCSSPSHFLHTNTNTYTNAHSHPCLPTLPFTLSLSITTILSLPPTPCISSIISIFLSRPLPLQPYGVATISRLLKITGLYCRI